LRSRRLARRARRLLRAACFLNPIRLRPRPVARASACRFANKAPFHSRHTSLTQQCTRGAHSRCVAPRPTGRAHAKAKRPACTSRFAEFVCGQEEGSVESAPSPDAAHSLRTNAATKPKCSSQQAQAAFGAATDAIRNPRDPRRRMFYWQSTNGSLPKP
jgi:hypothetical protein